MAGKGNPKGTNNGGGKPRRPNARKHTIMVDNGVWDYLNRNKQSSAEIEKLVREKMNEKRLIEIAEAIYNEVSGADNKQEHAATVQDVYEWLRNGDTPGAYTMADVPALAAEWREWGGE